MKCMNIAIFVSGSGTNCENIIRYFSGREDVCCKLVVSNRSNAYALERAKRLGVAACVVPKADLQNPDIMLPLLRANDIHFIVLAGFLPMVPDYLLDLYPRRIVNIHPALLPKYGGKGFYGHKVHEAALASGDKESGITIHYVNNEYDSGDIIFKATCPILPDDTPDSLAARVHALEYQHFPHVIEEVALSI